MTPARIQRLAAPLAAVAAGLVVLVCADAALAQQTVRPPSVERPESAPILWLGWAVAILTLAIVVSVSLIPSKRGHQD